MAGCSATQLGSADLDQAIQVGDWAAVGVISALMASKQSDDSSKQSLEESEESLGSDMAIESSRATELDQLVDAGDWEGLVMAAAKFDKQETLAASTNPSVPAVGNDSDGWHTSDQLQSRRGQGDQLDNDEDSNWGFGYSRDGTTQGSEANLLYSATRTEGVSGSGNGSLLGKTSSLIFPTGIDINDTGKLQLWKRQEIVRLLDKCEKTKFPFKKNLVFDSLQLASSDIPVDDLCGTRLGNSLHKLSLSRNRLSSIPPRLVTQLPALAKLDLSGCELYELPDQWNLKSLKRLDLSHNRLQDFPDEAMLKGISELRELNLYGNRLTEIIIPNNPETLAKLENLNVGYNDLTFIPEELDSLYALRTLKVMNNFLEKVPMRVCDMALKVIDVSSNPIIQPPLETCERGIASMKRDYHCLQMEERSKKNKLATVQKRAARQTHGSKNVLTAIGKKKTSTAEAVTNSTPPKWHSQQQTAKRETPNKSNNKASPTKDRTRMDGGSGRLLDGGVPAKQSVTAATPKSSALTALDTTIESKTTPPFWDSLLDLTSPGGAVSDVLQDDKEFMLKACRNTQGVFQQASARLRDDEEVVLAACQSDGLCLQYASTNQRDNRKIVLEACKINAHALAFASTRLREDKDFVREICKICDLTGLLRASENLKDDKHVVWVACEKDGNAFKYASDRLRADKDIVIAAATSEPESLKLALGGLNQDRECLIAAGLWDEDYRSRQDEVTGGMQTKTKIVLSTRFSLSPDSTSQATQFAILLKNHDFIRSGGFVVYSPNAFDKATCDPEWTRITWPCRGTYETCTFSPELKTGVPSYDSCWRYSFRYQLQEAKRVQGFMIQFVEVAGPNYMRFTKGQLQELGAGQAIEREMAQELKLKVFRVHAPIKNYRTAAEYESDFVEGDMDEIVSKIHEWYEGDCNDMTDCTIQFIRN